MAKKENQDNLIETLKAKGLTCSKLRSMINNQERDAKKARDDANMFRKFNIISQAELQEKVAKAEEKSADDLRKIRKNLCPLK